MGEIFGIGIEELIFIGILIALLFGPESIPKIARAAGKLLNQLFRSPLYKQGLEFRKQIQDLPSALARLAELEDIQNSLNSEIRDLKAAIEPLSNEKISQSIASVLNAPTAASAAPPADAASEKTIAPAAPAHRTGDPRPDDTD